MSSKNNTNAVKSVDTNTIVFIENQCISRIYIVSDNIVYVELIDRFNKKQLYKKIVIKKNKKGDYMIKIYNAKPKFKYKKIYDTLELFKHTNIINKFNSNVILLLKIDNVEFMLELIVEKDRLDFIFDFNAKLIDTINDELYIGYDLYNKYFAININDDACIKNNFIVIDKENHKNKLLKLDFAKHKYFYKYLVASKNNYIKSRFSDINLIDKDNSIIFEVLFRYDKTLSVFKLYDVAYTFKKYRNVYKCKIVKLGTIVISDKHVKIVNQILEHTIENSIFVI